MVTIGQVINIFTIPAPFSRNSFQFMLELKNICKVIGHKDILSNINVTIEKGEVLGLLGRNGSGKSTLLKILASTVLPTKGTIVYTNGQACKVSSIFENYSFLSHLSGWQNIAVTKNFCFDAQELNRLFEHYELFKDRKAKYGTYSSGMKRKLDIIFTLLSHANLFLLDEPTNSLDIETVNLFLKDIQQQKKRNRSIMISSHVASDLEKVCDRILILERGEITERISMESLHQRKMSLEDFYLARANKA